MALRDLVGARSRVTLPMALCKLFRGVQALAGESIVCGKSEK
jgi:hypothetical protein